MRKPLSPSKVADLIRDPKTRIVMARQDAVKALTPYVDRVLAAVKEVADIRGAVWISDKSCVSDFLDPQRDRLKDPLLYSAIGQKLGIPLDRANADDHVIVKIARKLKLHTTS